MQVLGMKMQVLGSGIAGPGSDIFGPELMLEEKKTPF